MAWFSTDEGVWEAAVLDLPKPWPEAFARMDLRYHENRHRMKVAPFPGRVALSNRWGWTDRKVRNLLEADDWHDTARPVAREDLRGKWDGARQQPANTLPTACQQDNGQTPEVTENPPTACQQPANSVSIARVSLLTTGNNGEPRSEIPAAHAAGPSGITGGLFATLTQPEPAPTIEIEPTPEPKATRKARAAKGATAGASQVKERTWGYQEAIDAWDQVFGEVMETAYPWIWTGQYANGKHVKTWLAAARIKSEADVLDGIDRIRGAALAYLRAVKVGAAWPREEKPNVARFSKDIAQWLQTDPNARPRLTGKIDPNQATRDALNRALEELQQGAK